MKKISYLTSILAILVGVLLLAQSCKKDEPQENPVDNTPVLGTNFNYTVDKNVVMFTTTLTGNVWWTQNGTDYPAVDQKAEVAFAEAGTYNFTCSTLDAGVTKTSAAFDVVVEEGDPTIYDKEWWINLTGGYGKSREWVLDVDAKVLPGPLSFYGTSWDFVANDCADDVDCWWWDADLLFTFEDDSANVRMDWPGAEGYGVMTFDLIDGKHFNADKKKEDPESGTYVFDWENRMITITGATILRSYKPFAQVKDDPNCEGDECPTHMEDGITGISDWQNYRVLTLSDTLLRLAVSRDQDVHGEGVAWLVYNFVAKEIYDNIIVDPPPVFYEPVLTSFTAADLEGTWAIADVAQDWIGWPETGTIGGKRLNGWTNRAEMIETLAGWGAEDPEAVFTAADANEYIFNGDGSCTLAGVANTYSVTDGVITFGNPLAGELALVWIELTGTDVSVLDVQYDVDGNPYTPDGIWIGQKNGEKAESSSIQLIKK